MTMTTMATRPSSASEASSSPASKRAGLRGPRPQPLKVSPSSSRGSSTACKPPTSSRKGAAGAAAPVIVYEHAPRVVHARPQEFMTVVQRLTGKPVPAIEEEGGDPLLLTLGQRPAAPPALPSSPVAAGMFMSPSFIFSPNTMQSIQELSPLF